MIAATPTPIAIVSVDKDLQDTILSIPEYQLLGVVDSNAAVDTGGMTWLGTDGDWPDIRSKYPGVRVVMAVDPCRLKRRLLEVYGVSSIAIVRSRDSYIAQNVVLGQGAIVQRGVKLMPDVSIGLACKININVVLHHDCVVGDCCTIAPGAQLLGNVIVEDDVYIGAGAILLPRVHVGAGSVIGAGAVVAEDVPANVTVVGVPARPTKPRELSS